MRRNSTPQGPVSNFDWANATGDVCASCGYIHGSCENSFMTRSEFIERFQQSKRRQDRLGFGVCGLLAVTSLAGIPLAETLDLNRPNPTLIIFSVFGIAMVVIASVLVRMSIKAAMRCPQCGRQIVGYSGQVVIASGRCG